MRKSRATYAKRNLVQAHTDALSSFLKTRVNRTGDITDTGAPNNSLTTRSSTLASTFLVFRPQCGDKRILRFDRVAPQHFYRPGIPD